MEVEERTAGAEEVLIGRPVLVVVDIQEAAFGSGAGIPVMAGYADRMLQAVPLVEAARASLIPVIFTQESHSRTRVDFGRELDGAESVHCLEDDPATALYRDLRPQDDEYVVVKRRYSAFFGTDFEILLRGLGAKTLVLCGGLTDVCVHYTFVDAHQFDYHVRVVADAVAGSSEAAHEAALRAMEYLQTDALTTTDAMVEAFSRFEGPPRPTVQSGPASRLTRR